MTQPAMPPQPLSLFPASPVPGMHEWFRPGEYDHVEQVLSDLHCLGISELHTGFSWADWHTDAGQRWYSWLLPRLAREVNLLLCFTYTPPSLGLVSRTASPVRRPQDYADFLDIIISRFGQYFEWVELWNEPNNLNDWDWRLDPGWKIFCEMIGGAAYWVQQRGKKTVLGGLCPTDPSLLDLLCRRGVMQYIDVVGVHGFPGTWEFDWQEWSDLLPKVQEVLIRHDLTADIWITETGYSTWRHDEYRQLCDFAKVASLPVSRFYWYSAYDLHPDLSHQDGFHEDERHYHFGLKRADGKPKLLARVLAEEGLEGVKALARLGRVASRQPAGMSSGNGTHRLHAAARTLPSQLSGQPPILITGGAGFIGTNLAHRLVSAGKPVLIVDNLSRPGVEENVRWLYAMHGESVQVRVADVRDPYVLREVVQQACQVFHFAAQVAVTSSLLDPVEDFAINVQGTLHLLEALRRLPTPPPLVFTSTNKVYGALEDIALRPQSNRYEPIHRSVQRNGIGEERPLDFYSPYGCSKGAADQYVIDYARMYDLPAVVFRMSCIYGPHQRGTEDQGWVAHFLIRALAGAPITLYGDGMQVRDILFVQDLVDALLLAQEYMPALAGEAFNIGGGSANTTSLLELLDLIGELHGEKPDIRFAAWRPGDQKHYVSDIRKFAQATGWGPQVNLRHGVTRLYTWLCHPQNATPDTVLAVKGAREGYNGNNADSNF